MIYVGATGLGWVPFDGAEMDADDDLLVVLQSSEPEVLETRANAIGAVQAIHDPSRALGGVQLAGAGKGKQFTLAMLFSRTSTMPTGLNQMLFDASGSGVGIAVFLFSGSSEPELNHRKQDALARARAWAPVDPWAVRTWRGCEIAGSGDGRTFMGLLIVRRAPS